MIDGIELEYPLMNASGPGSSTFEQMKILECVKIGAIVSKTSTYKPKKGFDTPNVYFDSHGSVNAIGLRNAGFDYYSSIKLNKPYILSIYPEKEIFDDYRLLEPDFIEVNISCPNVGYVDDVLRFVDDNCPRRYGIKMQPMIDRKKLEELCDVFDCFPKLIFITACNTLPNGIVIKNDKPYLSNTFGGIGGKYIKPLSLSNVYTLSNNCKKDIIGCGGISSYSDMRQYMSCGAKAVQIGTHYFQHGPKVFDDIMLKSHL